MSRSRTVDGSNRANTAPRNNRIIGGPAPDAPLWDDILSTRPEFYQPPTLDKTPPPKVTKRTAASYHKRELTISGSTSNVALSYGYQKRAWDLLYVFKQSNDVIWLVLGGCWGEIEGVQKVWANKKDTAFLNSTVWQAWAYNGTPTQGVDPNLSAVDASWNETLLNKAYMVVRLGSCMTFWQEFPEIVVEWKAKKILDPETGVTAYSTNPILQHYDWARHIDGKNLPVSAINTASVIAAKNAKNALIPSSSLKRLESHVDVREGSVEEWEQTWRVLNGMWFPFIENQFHVILDAAASSVATINDDHVVNSSDGGLDGGREDVFDAINQVIVEWADPAKDYQLVQEIVSTAAVDAGTEPPNPATYRMPWIRERTYAYQMAVRILNDAAFDWRLTQEWQPALANRALGEVVTITTAQEGISQDVRIMRRDEHPDGSCIVELREENAGRYSDTVVTAPAKIGSTFFDADATPPGVSGVSGTEELYQRQHGFYSSRYKLTFTRPDYVFFDAIEIWQSIDGAADTFYEEIKGIAATSSVLTTYIEGVEDMKPRVVKIYVRSKFDRKSAAVTHSFTPLGKQLPPSDVASIVAGFTGDRVLLWWQKAVDIDLMGYEVRRGTTTDTWASAKLVGVFTGLTATDTPPPSLLKYRYFVKAFDSGNRYSTNAASCDVNPPLQSSTTQGSERALYPRADTSYVAGSPSRKWESSFTEAVANQLFYGTGNLVVEDISTYSAAITGLGVGPDTHRFVRAFLCRAFNPNTADAEISAGSYASLSAWEAAVDTPRRTYRGVEAPLWAPLPANAAGEIWSHGNFQWHGFNNSAGNTNQGNAGRMQNITYRLLNSSAAGADYPENQANALAMIYDWRTNEKYFEPSHYVGSNGAALTAGMRLTSNSPFFQMMAGSVARPSWQPSTYVTGAAAPLNAAYVWGVLFSSDTKTIKTGGLTTDGTGYGYIDVENYFVANPVLSSSSQLEIQLTAADTGSIGAVVDTFPTSVDASPRRIKVKTLTTSTGALAPSKSLSYILRDAGAQFGFAAGVA